MGCVVRNAATLANAPRTVRAEGDHYFPPESMNGTRLIESRTQIAIPVQGHLIGHHCGITALPASGAGGSPHQEPCRGSGTG